MRRMIWFLLIVILLQVNVGGVTGELVLIESADAKGAVCLDGSPPAYEIVKGFGEGENNWLIMVQGGAWCNSAENCRVRQREDLGSSRLMKPLNFSQGLLGMDRDSNPDFYNWNKVTMRYCDGSSFTGDVEEVDPATNNHYRGARVFHAIVEHLIVNGMDKATNVLFAGGSAGGLAVILNCDKFHEFLPNVYRYKCLSDGGYFPHAKDLAANYSFEIYFDAIVNTHGSTKNLPLGCTSVMKPASLCFYPQYAMPYVRSPMFILNSAYDTYQIDNMLATWITGTLRKNFEECIWDLNKCSPEQQQRLQEFRSEFLDAVSVLNNSATTGYFINSCYDHVLTFNRHIWLGNSASLRVGNKSVSEAISDWFFDRAPSRRIDREHVLPYYC